jgi:hypothetical protein
LSHLFSKWKTFGFGMVVERDRRMGVWSEVAFGSEVREELGKAAAMGALRKTLSRRARVGVAW